MAKTEHVHKFKRHKYSTGRIIFFCALPDCSKKLAPALALGKKTLCWRCEQPFILNEYAVRLVKPHCEKCHQVRTVKEAFVFKPENSVIPIEDTETVKQLADLGVPPRQSSLADRLSKVVNSKKINFEEGEDEL